MADFIVSAIVVLVVGLAVAYLIKERKRGVKCIGCPAGGTCCACRQGRESVPAGEDGKGAGGCSGCSGCHGNAG